MASEEVLDTVKSAVNATFLKIVLQLRTYLFGPFYISEPLHVVFARREKRLIGLTQAGHPEGINGTSRGMWRLWSMGA